MALDATALVTLDEAKDYLGISGTAQDNKLSSIINGASLAIENYCKVPMIQQTFAEKHSAGIAAGRGFGYSELGLSQSEFYGVSLRRGGAKLIWLYKYPVVSVASIVDEAGNAVASTDYYIDKAKGVLEHSGSWPIPYDTNGYPGNWTVTYVAGRWSDESYVPGDVRLACLMLVADTSARLSPSVGSLNSGALSVSFTSDGGALPMAVRNLVTKYRGNRI